MCVAVWVEPSAHAGRSIREDALELGVQCLSTSIGAPGVSGALLLSPYLQVFAG